MTITRVHLRGVSKLRLFAVCGADTMNSDGLKQKKGNGCKQQEAFSKNTS